MALECHIIKWLLKAICCIPSIFQSAQEKIQNGNSTPFSPKSATLTELDGLLRNCMLRQQI